MDTSKGISSEILFLLREFSAQICRLFFNWVIYFLDFSCFNFLCALNISPWADVYISKSLCYSMDFFSTLLLHLLDTILFVYVVPFVNCYLNSWTNRVLLRKSFPAFITLRELPQFSSSFGVSVSTLGSLNHLELIIAQDDCYEMSLNARKQDKIMKVKG